MTSIFTQLRALVGKALTVCAVFATTSAFALNYNVQFTATAPTIDGTVDSAWSSASAAATGFVDRASSLTVSTQQTNVRLLWDSSKLYVLYEATDDAIVASATANDTGFNFTASPQDAAVIMLDPSYNQNRAGMVYNISVNPAANCFTYTESGIGQLAWNLTSASQIAFAPSGSNWTVEMAIPWTELNSKLTDAPGVVIGPPGNGSIWGAQFGRYHSSGNNVIASKWNPTAATTMQGRTLGSLTFQGGPPAVGLSIPGQTTLYATGFEPPAFTAGTSVDGIEMWGTSFPLFFKATSAEFKSGAQSMEIVTSTTGQTAYITTVTGSQGTVWVQYACKLSPEMVTTSTAGYRHVLYLTGEYTTGTDTLGSIWFYARPGSNSVPQGGNDIQVNSYESQLENTATGVHFTGLQTLGDWAYVTVKINESAKTYEVWYNGQKLAQPGRADYYGAKARSVFLRFDRLTFYSANYGGTISGFYDDLSITTPIPSNGARDWSLFE
jgi:hypothetical protein